jgi:hypothetical protein
LPFPHPAVPGEILISAAEAAEAPVLLLGRQLRQIADLVVEARVVSAQPMPVLVAVPGDM